jgi:hypothetical protein
MKNASNGDVLSLVDAVRTLSWMSYFLNDHMLFLMNNKILPPEYADVGRIRTRANNGW